MLTETGIEIIGKLTELGVNPAHLEKGMEIFGRIEPKLGIDSPWDGAVVGSIIALGCKFIAEYCVGKPSLIKGKPHVELYKASSLVAWIQTGLEGFAAGYFIDLGTDRF